MNLVYGIVIELPTADIVTIVENVLRFQALWEEMRENEHKCWNCNSVVGMRSLLCHKNCSR